MGIIVSARAQSYFIRLIYFLKLINCIYGCYKIYGDVRNVFPEYKFF
jgi:hypothetical protein